MNDKPTPNPGFQLFLASMGLLIACAALFGSCAAVKTYSRYQKVQDNKVQRKIIRLNAQNRVLVNETRIKQTHQLIQVEKQKAAIRVQEAKGIANAQQIINASLTPLYLQHEAIKAQMAMAKGENHTVVYVPSGDVGVPLVSQVPGAVQ